MAKITSLIKNIKFILIFSFGLRIVILFTSSFHPDLLNHLDWGKRFWGYGFQTFYEGNFWGVSWPNQPYFSMLLFALISKLNDWIFSFFWQLNQFISIFPSNLMFVLEKNLHPWLAKLPFIVSDIGLGFLIYKIIQRYNSKNALLAASFFLLNPVVIYNSTVWGQTDSLINLLALTGVYLIFSKKYHLGIFIFLSSFLFKLSLIIYLPVVLILVLKRPKSISKVFFSGIIFLLFALILAIPFSGDKSSLDWLTYMYQNRVLPRQGHMLNGNAFNLWMLFFGVNLSLSEYTKIGLFSAKQIGIFLFSIFSFISLIPILRKLSLFRLLLSCFFVSFSAFMFMTNMHERYLYPVIPLLTILVFLAPSFIRAKHLLLISLIHLLNLYNLWFYPSLPFLKNLLESYNYLLPRLLSLSLLLFYLNYLVKYLLGEKK